MIKSLKEKLKSNKLIYSIVKKIKSSYRYMTGVWGNVILFYLKYSLKKIGVIKDDQFVRSLKNKYEGKKIFVVATGPSLSVEVLDRLDKENAICISMNGIFKMFDKTKWRPDFYVMDDFWLTKKYAELYPNLRLDQIARNGVILGERCEKFISYKNEMRNAGYVPVCYFDHWVTHYSKKFKYNRNIVKGNFDFYTVTNFAINLADYMGAREVYLLGVDCDYTSGIAHAGDKRQQLTEEQVKNNIAMEYGMLSGYNNLAKLIGNNIRIYNVNSGGKVESFPRVTLDSAFDKQN